MANIKSQIKRNRQNEVRHQRNKAVRSELKTRIKNAMEAEGTEDAPETFRLAQRRIDTAAARGIINKRTAARRKSRLAKRLGSSKSA